MRNLVRACFIVAVASQVALASGFKLNEQSAKAGGMGLAFVGQADDATTIALNLAGMDQLAGTQVAVTDALIYVPGREFSSNTPLTLQDGQKADDQLADVPSFYFTSDLGSKRWHVGLGMYSMFGLTQDWNDIGLTVAPGPVAPPFGFMSDVDRVRLKTVFVNPCVSFEVIEGGKLALAAGFIYGHGWFDSKQYPTARLPLPSPPFPPGLGLTQKVAEFDTDVDGDGWSFNVGVHSRLSDCVRVGAYYRHSMDLDMHGHFEAGERNPNIFGPGTGAQFHTGADVSMTLPGTVGFGIAWEATKDLTLEADGEWNSWSNFDTLDVDLDTPLVAPGPIPVATDTNLTQHPRWNDSWAAHVGAQYHLSPCWDARLGYFFDQTPVPGSTLEPAVPDGDRNAVTAGVGYHTGGWSLDVAYMAVFIEDRSVNNAAFASVGGPVQNGDYSSDPVHVLMLTLGLKF